MHHLSIFANSLDLDLALMNVEPDLDPKLLDTQMVRTLVKSVYQKNIFSYFSTKTYLVGTQNNRLNKTVLLSTQNMLILMGKKIFRILRSKFLFI